MQRLILFRHGDAEGSSTSGRDIDRALTPDGRHAARLVGEALASQGVRPEQAVVSEALRTQQTWAAAHPAFESAGFRIEPRLYGGEASTLLHIAEQEPAATVMLVAHNPGVHELALQLAEDAGDAGFKARLQLGFPAAAAAVIEFSPDGAPQSGRLLLPSDQAAA